MATRRKLYKQGTSCVLSFPAYLLRDLGLEKGDYLLVQPLSATALQFQGVSINEFSERGEAYFRSIRHSALRPIYRQGNALVITVPQYILSFVDAVLGDYFILAPISDKCLMGTVKKAAAALYEDQHNYDLFHNRKPPGVT